MPERPLPGVGPCKAPGEGNDGLNRTLDHVTIIRHSEEISITLLHGDEGGELKMPHFHAPSYCDPERVGRRGDQRER